MEEFLLSQTDGVAMFLMSRDRKFVDCWTMRCLVT